MTTFATITYQIIERKWPLCLPPSRWSRPNFWDGWGGPNLPVYSLLLLVVNADTSFLNRNVVGA